MKDDMTVWERAEIAAKLSAIAYMNATKGQKASKAMGFTKARLIAKDGAADANLLDQARLQGVVSSVNCCDKCNQAFVINGTIKQDI